MKQLVHNMFITNNHTSFHLRRKKNLVKHQTFSKYYDHNCNMCIGIYLWLPPIPVLNHIPSKDVKLVTLWYNSVIATLASDETMIYSDEYYLKETWCTQTLLSQLLRGCNKNQIFHYFGLLHDLLHCVKICQINGLTED